MNTPPGLAELFRRPTAFLPFVLSGAALVVIGVHLAIHGAAPQPDEGTAAHLWQLLMAGQIPLMALFAVRWSPRAPRAAIPVLAVQLAAALAAAAPVYLLKW